MKSETLIRFVGQQFLVQHYIVECGLAEDGPDGTPEWDQYGYIAEPHLNAISNFLDPDWPEPVNARLLKLAVLMTRSIYESSLLVKECSIHIPFFFPYLVSSATPEAVCRNCGSKSAATRSSWANWSRAANRRTMC